MSKIYWSWPNIRGSLKRVWQNITRGWNDSDCWSLHYTLATYILPRLKRFKDIHRGGPADLNEKDWEEILNKMIYSFEQIISDMDNIIDDPTGSIKIHIDEGLELFAKYYRNLWD